MQSYREISCRVIPVLYLVVTDSKSQRTHSKPDNLEAMEDLAFHLSRATKFKHKYGNAFKLSKYAADGTIFDYMAGVKKVGSKTKLLTFTTI